MTDDVQGLGARSAAYVPRIVDAQIDKYLTLFGAIEVSGTKWCGKTWSSLAHAASVTYVDRGSKSFWGWPVISTSISGDGGLLEEHTLEDFACY